MIDEPVMISELPMPVSGEDEAVAKRLTSFLGRLDYGVLNDEAALEGLVAALDERERETAAHSKRVSFYAVRLAARFGVAGQALNVIRKGALLHDIGKIGISDRILLKPAGLTDEEWAEMRKHPEIGARILRRIPSLREAAEIVAAHHERFDGTGYPNALEGSAIPLGGRIFAIADTLDAILSDRPYRLSQTGAQARQEISAHAGTQFDPALVECFLNTPPEEWDIP